MEVEPLSRHTRREPLAPVAGGMHWLTPYFGVIDLFRDGKEQAARGCRPGASDSRDPSPPDPEPETAAGPHVISTPSLETTARREYVYHPRVYDSDCTGFVWYLEKCPRGMTVDRHSGKVVWAPPRGGYAEIALCARNIYGATARQRWTLCVRKDLSVRKPVFNRRFSQALKRKAARSLPPVRVCWRGTARRTGTRSLPATEPPGERFRADIPLRR